MNPKYNLGDTVKDSFSGLQGRIICRTQWLNGNIDYLIESEKTDRDGRIVRHQLFEQQLELVRASTMQYAEPGQERTGTKVQKVA